MIKLKLLIIGILVLPIALFSQGFEVGILVGGSNYTGDLSNNSSSLYLKEMKLAAGLFTRYSFNEYATARLHFNYAKVSGRDSNASDEFINNRNLNFKSNVLEFGLVGEFNILGFQPYNFYKTFSPYVFAGVAVYRYNPKAEYLGSLVGLQSLGTEGQGLSTYPSRSAYSLTQFAVPFGVGVKYAILESLSIGIEIGARKLFTDYLDDVSTTYVEEAALIAENGALSAALSNRTGESVLAGSARGDDKSNDWYYIAGVTISYHFQDTGLSGGRRKSRKKSGCKTY